MIESVMCKAQQVMPTLQLPPVLIPSYLNYLSDDRASFRAAFQMSIGPLKCQIAGFPATSRQRHEYYISACQEVTTQPLVVTL